METLLILATGAGMGWFGREVQLVNAGRVTPDRNAIVGGLHRAVRNVEAGIEERRNRVPEATKPMSPRSGRPRRSRRLLVAVAVIVPLLALAGVYTGTEEFKWKCASAESGYGDLNAIDSVLCAVAPEAE